MKRFGKNDNIFIYGLVLFTWFSTFLIHPLYFLFNHKFCLQIEFVYRTNVACHSFLVTHVIYFSIFLMCFFFRKLAIKRVAKYNILYFKGLKPSVKATTYEFYNSTACKPVHAS